MLITRTLIINNWLQVWLNFRLKNSFIIILIKNQNYKNILRPIKKSKILITKSYRIACKRGSKYMSMPINWSDISLIYNTTSQVFQNTSHLFSLICLWTQRKVRTLNLRPLWQQIRTKD